MTKTLVFALLTGVAWGQACAAATPEIVPASGPAILADWQYPESLPPRYRNHCSTEYLTNRHIVRITAAAIINSSIARKGHSAAVISAAATVTFMACCAVVRDQRAANGVDRYRIVTKQPNI